MGKKFINLILLIGILFSTFHDFVFYNIDPCMTDVSSVIEFEKGNSNDPLCDIHHELHTPVTTDFNITLPVLIIEHRFESFYQNPYILGTRSEIFKPPQTLS